MLQATARPAAEDVDLRLVAAQFRARLVELSHQAGTAHLGGSLSCADIMVAAYWGVLDVDAGRPEDPARDRLILSKGHAATSLYVALAMKGFFPEAMLDDYAEPGSPLAEHPSLGSVPGVEISSGSLGHGLSIGIGMALGLRLQAHQSRVFVVMSDGECNEGSVWEAAMFAPIHKLDRLVAIIDFNRWQATGRSEEVMALQPLADKWKAFGWSTYEVDGHDPYALRELLSSVPDGSGKPIAVVAHTVKGKGVSFIEDDNNWHYRIPTTDEVIAAKRELGIVQP